MCLRNWGSPGDSVVFHMSEELDSRIEAAEADYKTAVKVVENRIRDAEDSYIVFHGKLRVCGEYLNRFAESLAKEMDNDVPGVPTVATTNDDSGESIQDDPDIYYYRCAFCSTVLDTGAELKTHIDSFHQHELFQFRCDTCGFKAEGPKYLRGHRRLVHNDHGAGEYPQSSDDSSDDDYKPCPFPDGGGEATRANERRAPMDEGAIGRLRPPPQRNNEVTSTSGGGVGDPWVPNNEVVTLKVRDMSDSSGGDVREIVTLKAVNMPDSGGSDSDLLCPTCQSCLKLSETWITPWEHKGLRTGLSRGLATQTRC